jgi:hypothetical protein
MNRSTADGTQNSPPSAGQLKIEAYGDAVIFALAGALGLVVALDATAAWFWRLLILCVVTFTLGIIHPAIRFGWSKLSELRR